MKNMNNQEKNTYVRQHILSALLELMETQEFASISIQALVDAAGVGRASFYRNFASKEDVLQQESVRLTNEWKTKFDQEHPDGTPGQRTYGSSVCWIFTKSTPNFTWLCIMQGFPISCWKRSSAILTVRRRSPTGWLI